MSLPRYIVNFDEFTDELKKELLELINNELKDKYPQLNTNNISILLEDLKELLPYKKYEGLKNKIDTLVNTKIEETQKIKGKLLDIPPIINNYKEIFKFDSDIYLTGLHFNQTGWKKEDKFDLVINKNKIINNATIKEIGEHKYFNTYYPLVRGKPISFVLHNNSGNSRQVMVDLEYLKAKLTPNVDPNIPENTPAKDAEGNKDIPIIIPHTGNGKKGINKIGYIDINENINELIIEGNFSTITGLLWPDLNLICENKTATGVMYEWYGFNCTFCNSQNKITENGVSYTGWGAPIEKYVIKNPKKGRWYIQGRGFGATKDSKVTIKVNMSWKLTNIQI